MTITEIVTASAVGGVALWRIVAWFVNKDRTEKYNAEERARLVKENYERQDEQDDRLDDIEDTADDLDKRVTKLEDDAGT